MRVGIIGCGLIGEKRAASLLANGDVVAAAFDVVSERSSALARKYGAEACASVGSLLGKVDACVVATTHDHLVPTATEVVRAGKHLLLEKPAARSGSELAPLVILARERRVVVKVGYNHRFHPAAQKARAILDAGGCGDVLFVRGRYGHGGRIGYDKEWRADRAKSGGGELLDQGVHLVDLARWFIGADFTEVSGRVETYFWDMPVEDNAFLTLGTSARQVAHLQASWTEWKNMFSLEIYARHTKLQMEGLGGSYGVERLYHYQMHPKMGPPETVVYEYPGADGSWSLEWADFKRAVADGTAVCGGLEDALAVLRVVDRVYALNQRS
ncbi:MAG TPA: Gfo/Idh/MocA family oxidoreductase [Polyangiaceae bacterium]|nr:Gfo/Idh/MocA family oxidoreductase [Polyangiaceae bacterium]